jgi:tryptophan synthase alpha chain
MNRIEKLFAANSAFVGYLTAGDGGIECTLQAALALLAGGVNVLEIGIPFSDPIADGPVIQRAMNRALIAGTSLQDILWLVKQIRQHSEVPIVLFSYFNPILSALKNNFLQQAKAAGVDGILIVDLPFELVKNYFAQCAAEDIAPILVISPTTNAARIQKIAQKSRGFLYYACRKGTTGMREGLPQGFAEKLASIKSRVSLPVVVGFGLSDKATTAKVLEHADGFVIGSLFVKAMEEGAEGAALTKLAASINPLQPSQ